MFFLKALISLVINSYINILLQFSKARSSILIIARLLPFATIVYITPSLD